MNDWDKFDNFPTDDDDNDEFDWMNEDSEDFDLSADDNDLSWLAGDDDEEVEEDAPQEWQMPRPDRAERDIASQMEEAEDAEFGDPDELLDWMSDEDDESEEELAAPDMPDWLSDMDIPEVSPEDIAAAQADVLGYSDVDNDDWGATDDDDAWGVRETIDEPETEGESWLASTADEDEADDFLFGAAASDDEDDADDFLFGAAASDDDQDDDFLFGAASSDDEDDADDFLFGAASSDDEDDADDFLFGASASDDEDDEFAPALETESSHSRDFGEWGDLGDTDFGAAAKEEPIAEDAGWSLSDDDDDFGFMDEPAAAISYGDDELEIPDWLADMPIPGEEEKPPKPEDLEIPEWLLDDGIDEEEAEILEDDFGFFDDEEYVADAIGDDLGDLLGDFDEDSADLSDLLATLDTSDDDGDLNDLLSSLGNDAEDAGLDDLFASLETSASEEPIDDLDFFESMSEDDVDDLDFLEPVAQDNVDDLDFFDFEDDQEEYIEEDEFALLDEMNAMNTSDIDFMEGISRVQQSFETGALNIDDLEDDEIALLNKLNSMRTSELDFMEGVSRNEMPVPDLDDDEIAILNKLSAMKTGELDFMEGVSRVREDDETDPELDAEELAILNQLNAMKTGELDFMQGISRVQNRLETGEINIDDLEEEEVALINKLSSMRTSELDFMDDVSREEIQAPDLDDREIAILNKLSQRKTSELEFMEGVSREETGEFYQASSDPDLDFFDEEETGDDVQAWFDSREDKEKKPTTGSLAYLNNLTQAAEIDDEPDWLDEISGIDTDTLRRAAEATGKRENVDLDALIDSFDMEDAQKGDIAPAADLDLIFSEMDDEQRRQLPDDLPAEALPEWLQEIAKGTDAASAAALIRQRRDRSLDDLEDRLLDLRERGLELSSELSDEPENQQRLARVIPNIDEALTPARVRPGQAGLVTSPNISPEQEKRAELLQTLVGSSLGMSITGDDDARRARRRGNVVKTFIQHTDRIVIALLLVAAVLVPFIYPIFDEISVLPPGAFAEDSDEFAAFTLIENLNENDYVLLAVEYGATGARELDTATRSLLEHIITNGGVPVLVSSDAVGLLRAENMLVELLGEDGRNRDYYVAGLLPAGNIGLSDFAQNVATFTSTDLRSNPTNLGISSVDDFAVIVLISESGESVRNWMEQIAPITETGIIVVTGQSARPIALPYVTSTDNVIALLTSYEDAFTYQQMSLAIYNPSPTPSPTPTILDTPTLEASPTLAPTETATDIPDPTETPEITEESEDAAVPATSESVSGATAIPSLTARPTNTIVPTATNTTRPTATQAATDTPDSAELIEVAVISSESPANARSGAGTTFAVVASIPTGEQLAVLDRSPDGEWIQVVLPDGSSAWVATILVNTMEIPSDEFDGLTETTSSDTIQVGTIIGGGRANIRSGPGSQFDTVAGLDPGSQVRIIGSNDAGDWYNIVLPNGGEGWVASFLLTIEEIPEDQWQGASKEGFFPIYFSGPGRVAQADDEGEDTILVGRNASGGTWSVYADEDLSEVLVDIPANTEFIVLDNAEPVMQILLEDGQIGYIESRVVRTELVPRSEVEFAPTETPLAPTFTPSPTATATRIAAQITPAPLTDPQTRSSSRALGLLMAIVVIALGNLFWIFRWLGQREK